MVPSRTPIHGRIFLEIEIEEGDSNTNFFHKMANVHRRYNHVGILEVDGVLYEEESEVASQTIKFYQKLY